MTNEEAIKRIKSNMEYRKSWSMVHHDTLNTCISRLEENTKLKAEIDRLKIESKENLSIGCDLVHTVEELSKEITCEKNLRVDLISQIYDKDLEIDRLKSELEQATNLMPKICETCEYKELSSLSEPCYSCDDYVNWERKVMWKNE